MNNTIRIVRVILLAVIIISAIAVRAQKIEFGVQASCNYPLIPTVKEEIKNNIYPLNSGYIIYRRSTRYQESFETKPGGRVNVNMDFNLNDHFFVRSGIGMNLIRFIRRVKEISKFPNIQYSAFEMIVWNGYGRVSASSDLGKTFILSADIPVFGGYRFLHKKLYAGIGVTASFLAYSVQYRIFQNNTGPKRDNSSDGLSNCWFTLNAEFSYIYKERYSVFGRYSEQLNPVFDESYQYGGKARYHLLELGLGYKIKAF